MKLSIERICRMGSAAGVVLIFILAPIALSAGQDDYVKAIKQLENERASDPQDIKPYQRLATLYRLRAGNAMKSLEVCLEGLRRHPQDCQLNRRAMYAYFELGEVDVGLAYYRLLANMNCGNFRVTRAGINKITSEMEDEEIITFCRNYLSLNPEDESLIKTLARTYMKQKKYALAEEQLKELINDDRNEAITYSHYATCKYNLGQYKEALKYFEKSKQQGCAIPERFFEIIRENMQRGNSENVAGTAEASESPVE